MGFSEEWEERYSANTNLSIWPWSDLVSYIMRYARPDSTAFSVLELGCGAGANIPFFQHMRVQYYAIEGSETIVNSLWARFPDLKSSIVVGDFTRNIPFDTKFDLIIDRSSLTHNSTADIEHCLTMIYDKLKPNGKYIGIDWFSTSHSDYAEGQQCDEVYTRRGYTRGQFSGVGRVHFSDQAHLQQLFSAFAIEILEHKIVKREIPSDNHVFASWNLVAVKR